MCEPAGQLVGMLCQLLGDSEFLTVASQIYQDTFSTVRTPLAGNICWGGWNWVPLFPAHCWGGWNWVPLSQDIAGVDGTGFHFSQLG